MVSHSYEGIKYFHRNQGGAGAEPEYYMWDVTSLVGSLLLISPAVVYLWRVCDCG